MKGAGKRSEGRSGQRRTGAVLRPLSKTERDNIMTAPAAIAHLHRGGFLREIELVLVRHILFNTRFAQVEANPTCKRWEE